MSNYLEKIKEFHKTFNHPISDQGENIDITNRQLRVKLLFEELMELADALDVKGTFADLCVEALSDLEGNNKDGDDVNKVEEIDALADLQVVLSGAIITLGHHEVFDEAFDEVHRSNMSKMCDDMDQVRESMEWYVDYKGETDITYQKQENGKYILYRKSDNKVLKNKYYTPADLKKFTC